MRKAGDWLGIASTAICLIHCVATPMLILASGMVLGLEGVEYLALLGAFLAVYFVWPHAHTRLTRFFLLVGLMFLTGSVLAEHFVAQFVEIVPYVKYSGSGILIATHLNNIRLGGKH